MIKYLLKIMNECDDAYNMIIDLIQNNSELAHKTCTAWL